MAVYNKFRSFVEHVAEGVHNLQTGALVIALTVASPVNVARLVKSANVEITAGDKPGTFDVPMTITDPKGVVLRLKDDKPLILKVTVK